MDEEKRYREPRLWWVAGADSEILAGCPRADQIFVQHLGISLLAAFAFVFLISTISILVAFPDSMNSYVSIALALGFAFLIAAMVFLIDRLFIQSDWDWQAAKQRRELARAAWEVAPLHERLAENARELQWAPRLSRFAVRFLVISFRVLLSAAIGLTIASFLELVIYKDELKPLVQKLHYLDNRAIYDEIRDREAKLDQEIQAALTERNRLLVEKIKVEAEVNNLEIAQPALPSDETSQEINSQIESLRKAISEEEKNVRRYSEDMVAETRGTLVNPGNSGLEGKRKKYWTAFDLKVLSEKEIAKNRAKIASLELEKSRAIAAREGEREVNKKSIDERRGTLNRHLTSVTSLLSDAQIAYQALENGRASSIEDYTSFLKKKPNFVPISFGAASQFRALRTLYQEYGSTFEMVMIKVLIMMLEMLPVLQKVFLSPTTLYAVRLDAAKRSSSYAHYDEEVRLRQNHLRRKADAAMDEELHGRGIEGIRESKITSIYEGRGAG